MPPSIDAPHPFSGLDRRLLFLGIYLFNVLTAREGTAAQAPEPDPYWQSPQLLEGQIDRACGLVEAPVGAGAPLDKAGARSQPLPAFL
ncbi:hypothetical protein ACFOGJ_17405 [Marinibaculum pumilum]|uniref:Uncharacterized protein n=1 Tax=Marinibaculum pumilum TaxID=1766165 RepID=A0ABV7L3T7_9PROT